MTARRVFLRRLLADLVFFGFLHSLLSVGVCAVFQDMQAARLSLLLAVPFLGMCALRFSDVGLPAFLAGIFALAAWPLLPFLPFPREFPQLLLRYAWLLLLLASALRALILRLRAASGLERGGVAFAVAVNAAAMLACERFGLEGALPALFLWAFAYAAAYVAHSQTLRVDESLSILPASAERPTGAILRFNNAMLAAFLAAAGALALLAARLPLGRAAGLIGGAALAALRMFVSALLYVMRLFSSGEAPQQEEPPQPPPAAGEPFVMPEAAEAPAWAQALGAIMLRLAWVALAAAAAFALAYGCYRLHRRFYGARYSDGDLREYIGPARGAAAGRARARARAVLGSLALRLLPKTEAERIRRAYFKKVRRHIKRGAGVLPADTAGEIAAKILPNEDIGALTALYNRARYSRWDGGDDGESAGRGGEDGRGGRGGEGD
ncbi:MAG: hypothetical protein LBL83_13650 [Clostridiales bacterium]|jgi:hypothetical protein|nr:hypothetical protein [Clostridiales bacterium]